MVNEQKYNPNHDRSLFCGPQYKKKNNYNINYIKSKYTDGTKNYHLISK